MAGIAERHRLHDLCHKGKLKHIREHLENDPNAIISINEPAGVFGYTPLHEAVSSRNANILQLLLTYGGHVDALSNGNYTPLHIAASIGDVECIRVLLEYSADLSLRDEFGKTPFATAQLNKRKKAARLLKTAEVKLRASKDDGNLGKFIEHLQCGQDVEENCFEDALQIAVGKNNHKAVGYLVIHGSRNLEACLTAALQKPPLFKSAALLLLCNAAKNNDREVIKAICQSGKYEWYREGNKEILQRKFLPAEWSKSLKWQQLYDLREAADYIDMAFPISIALNEEHYDAASIFLFQKYCKDQTGEADWHGLALSVIPIDWIERISKFKRLVLSHNILTYIPPTIAKMKNLLRLDLSRNNILEVPKEIFELPDLRNLNLSRNEIESLPPVDEWSKSMKILNLQLNNLKTIHVSIEKSELEELDLADNNLTSIPLCICGIKSLTTLDISRNRYITVFPPELAKLTRLSFLGMKGMDQVTDPPLGLRETTCGLLRHLRARLRNSEAYYTMKLMIVGLANRGKTTLMHRLDKDYAFNKNQSTRGVEIKEITISKMRDFVFRCWDFAGQEEYYATHQCFLSQRSLYLLVWNVSEEDEGIAGLKPWLDNLESRVPQSTIIIVGTHFDLISEEKRAMNFENRINGKISEMVSKYKKLENPENAIMMITCNPRAKECKERIEQLRQLIYTTAENMTVAGAKNGPRIMGEMIPSSYLSLARKISNYQMELQAQNKIPIIRKCEFEDLVIENANKNSRDIFDPDDVDNATKFLHEIGTILHYNDPNQDLRDLYFINPSWLCELMAKVVTVREAHNFIRDGVLSQKDIPFIIAGNEEKFPKKFYNQFLRLLYRFQIACMLDETRVLIPSQLPEDFPVELARSLESPQLLIRWHSFSCIPHGFWSRFIGRFLLYLKDMLTVGKMKDTVAETSKQGDTPKGTLQCYLNDNLSSKERDVLRANNAEHVSHAVDQSHLQNSSSQANKSSESNGTVVDLIDQNRLNITDGGNSFENDTAASDSFVAEPVNNGIEPVNSDIDPIDYMTNPIDNETEAVNDEIEAVNCMIEPIDNETGPVNDEIEPVNCKIDPIDREINRVDCPIEDVHDDVNECSQSFNQSDEIIHLHKEINLLDDECAFHQAKSTSALDKELFSNGLFLKKEGPEAKDVVVRPILKRGKVSIEDGETPFLLNDVVFTNSKDSVILNSSSPEDVYSAPASREVTPVSLDDTYSTTSSKCSTPGLSVVSKQDSNDKEISTLCDTMTVSNIQHENARNGADSSPLVSSYSFRIKNVPQRLEENDVLIEPEQCRQPEADDYFADSIMEEGEFNEPVDIAYLFQKKYLKCWRKGILFTHPKLFLSVCVIPSNDSRQIIETKVSKTLLGYRALSFIVDHIRSLVKEWYPGLSGNNGRIPYVRQQVPCPICIDFGLKPPYLFDINDCLKASIAQEYILCSNRHNPQIVSLRNLSPDIMFMDLEASMQLNPSELNFVETKDHQIGNGQFGTVYRGTYRGKPAAIKLSKAGFEDEGGLRDALDNFYDVRQEVIILSKVKIHPYIVSFLGVSVRPKLCSVMELASQGTLRKAINGKMGDMERIVTYRVCQQIASALTYLHQRGIVHRDLKSDNVLLFSADPASDVNVKLTDFGTADFMSCTGLKSFAGTKGFVAPEMLAYSRTDDYSAKVDVYSFAMVIYESITKRRPFQNIPSVIDVNRQVKDGVRPSFGDVLPTKFGFLTLTELMLRSWNQEATQRPSAYETLKQLRCPAFCLLFGKTPLGKVQSPRHMCFLPANNELWIACDDKSGSSIVVLDLTNGEIKVKFNPTLPKAKVVNFNIFKVWSFDKHHVALILRSTNDFVVFYSTPKKKYVDSYMLKNDYIRSLVTCESYVFLGCEDGGFIRIAKKDFLKGKFREKRAVVNEKRSISALAASDSKLFVGCDKYVYKYPLNYEDPERVELEAIRPGSDKQHVSDMIVSNDDKILFTSFTASPIITCRSTETMSSLGDINCSDVIRMLLPNSDLLDQRVTCFCVHSDTLWAGTGSGHILIYQINNDAAPSFITWMHPYKLEVRCIEICTAGPDCITSIVTIGKELNENGLSCDSQGLIPLDSSFPIDKSLLKMPRGQTATDVQKECANDNKNVLLLWDAVQAATLKRLISLH